MKVYVPSNVVQLEKQLGASWPNLQKARDNANVMNKKLEDILPTISSSYPFFYSGNISIIIFGSLARKEFTRGSDIDWTLLVDGPADTQHLDVALTFKEELARLTGKKVGQEGTFEGLAFSHDIIHKIGGSDDTNKNTTQRILLLLESTSIGVASVRERIIKSVLKRYIAEDHRTSLPKVPRFLLNDIVRYWRTMAVDFGYKRRKWNWEGAAIRIIKLRMSRKLIYASGLLACFACVMDEELRGELSSMNYEEQNNRTVDYLCDLLMYPPLDILASIVLSHGGTLHTPAQKAFNSYDKFIEIISDEGNRKRLKDLRPEQVDSDSLYQECRDVCHAFEEGLSGIFLSENGTRLFELIKKYGVF